MSLEDSVNDMMSLRAVGLDPAHEKAKIITHDLRGAPLLAEFIKVGTGGGGSGI